MNNVKLPSDNLNAPSHPVRWAIGVALMGALVVAGATFGPHLQTTNAADVAATPAPVATATLSPSDLAAVQEAADMQAAQIAADNAAAALAAQQAAAAAVVVPAPAPKVATSTSYAPGKAPAGTPIRSHTDNDPKSGTYGQTIDGPEGFCASNGGQVVNGAQVCA
jgi:hypothetical protein